jgi:hypothetical protein
MDRIFLHRHGDFSAISYAHSHLPVVVSLAIAFQLVVGAILSL